MAIIGLVGFIGSGKGAVSDYLCTKGFIKESFANPLKDAVSIIFNWNRDLLEGDTVESRLWREQPDPYWSQHFGYEITPRLALQLMGTEACRDVFHDDIWVISLLNRVKNKDVVICDVRFVNEIEYIKNNGGTIIRIVRGEEPEWFNMISNIPLDDHTREVIMSKYPNVHRSEWDWVGYNFDKIVYNNDSLQELYKNVELILDIKK